MDDCTSYAGRSASVRTRLADVVEGLRQKIGIQGRRRRAVEGALDEGDRDELGADAGGFSDELIVEGYGLDSSLRCLLSCACPAHSRDHQGKTLQKSDVRPACPAKVGAVHSGVCYERLHNAK